MHRTQLLTITCQMMMSLWMQRMLRNTRLYSKQQSSVYNVQKALRCASKLFNNNFELISFIFTWLCGVFTLFICTAVMNGYIGEYKCHAMTDT